MSVRSVPLVLLLCIALSAMTAFGAVRADRAQGEPPPVGQAAPVPLSPPPWLTERGGPVTVMLQLEDPPGSTAPDRPGMLALGRRNALSQDSLKDPLAALGAQVLFQTQLAYNGIAVSIPATQLVALRALPGIAAVRLITPKARAGRVASQPAPGTPAWSMNGFETGRDVRIGIIDSGIDYTHAHFGGPGTPEAYTDSNRVFPTRKVVGGFDFAGDGYDASGQFGSPIPSPKADPLDCNGHGTLVAGLAGGYGVKKDGQTFTGRYTASLDLTKFAIPPGVAPEANLYALKIFGCQGTTALVTLALDYAIQLGLDVVNLSLGSPFGGSDDPDAVAADNAARAGIIVVTSAGDSGETFYSTSSPASARHVISVGASEFNNTIGATTVITTSRGPQRGNGPLKPDLVAPGMQVVSAAVRSGTGQATLSGSSASAPQVAGAAAVLIQGKPTWTGEQIKAALMNSATPLLAPNGAAAPPSLAGAGQLNVWRAAGLNLLAYASDGDRSVVLTYGVLYAAGPYNSTRQLTIENQSPFQRVIAIEATPTISATGVTVAVPDSLITIAGRSSAQVSVTASFDPATFDLLPDAATAPTQNGGFPRYALAERGGYVQTSTVSSRLRTAHSAATGPVQFFLDGRAFGDPLDPSNVSAYQVMSVGRYNVQVRAVGAAPGTPALLQARVTLPRQNNYTMVLVGTGAQFGIVLVDESPRRPPIGGHASIHFVNANRPGVGDAGPLDLYVDSLAQPLVAGLEVGAVSPYLDLPAGLHVAAFFSAGEQPTRSSLVSWQLFDALNSKLITVGSGQALTAGDLDACRDVLAQLDDTDGDLKTLLTNGTGSVPILNRICTALKRGFTAKSRNLRPPVETVARVPYQLFPTPASAARATVQTIGVPPGSNALSIPLENSGARTADPTATEPGIRAPLASAFELAAESEPLGLARPSLAAANVRYLGVTSNYSLTQTVDNTTLFFGIAAHGAWSTPNEVQYLIYIDSTGPAGVPDGKDDFVLLNTSLGLVLPPAPLRQPNDVFINLLYPIDPDTGQLLPATFFAYWNSVPAPQLPPSPFDLDAAPYNTSVLIMLVGAQRLGLVEGRTRFNYHVETRARDADNFSQVVDRVPALGQPDLSYDLTQAAVAPINTVAPPLQFRPLFVDATGSLITAAVNQASLQAAGSRQVLILHHHNQPGARAELVTVRTTTAASNLQTGDLRSRTFLPTVKSR
jgi:hypothetical protein